MEVDGEEQAKANAKILAEAETLLAAEKSLKGKMKVAEKTIYPALAEADKQEWIAKENDDRKRYESEMLEYKNAIAEHKKDAQANKFVKNAAGKLMNDFSCNLQQSFHYINCC